MDVTLLAGTANPHLAEAIARHLNVPLCDRTIPRYPDGEVTVELHESIARKTTILVQPTAPPVDANLMELLAMADVCRRNGAGYIVAVVPYFGYGRSDKRHGKAKPIMGSLAAKLMETAGIDRVVLLDPHAYQIEGFFSIPVDSLRADEVLCDAVRDALPEDVVVVSPDTGRVQMARTIAHRLGTSSAVLYKHRESGRDIEMTRPFGDVRDRPCLIVDDTIATGGTLARGLDALLEAGARPELTVAATHGLFVGNAREKLHHSALKRVWVTDAIIPFFKKRAMDRESQGNRLCQESLRFKFRKRLRSFES